MKITVTIFTLCLLMVACNEPISKKEVHTAIENQVENKVKTIRIPSIQRDAKSFDFPVGKPDAKGYYNAQAFGKNNHLGDDWNGIGGGNTDLGDAVFTIGNGVVISAENLGGGWGNVVRILHKHNDTLYESVYAHLDEMIVSAGNQLAKGDQIGTIGTADGSYLAHLHLEIRDTIGLDIGGGYSEDTKGYLNPTAFIKTH